MKKIIGLVSLLLVCTMILCVVPVSAKTSCNYCNPEYDCGCDGSCRGDCNICNKRDYEKQLKEQQKKLESNSGLGSIGSAIGDAANAVGKGAASALEEAQKALEKAEKEKEKSEGIGWDKGNSNISDKDVSESNIKVKMRGYTNKNGKVINEYKTVEFDVKPQLINDRTMVPIRAVAEELGYDVKWTNGTMRVDIIGTQNKIVEGELPYQCQTMIDMMKNSMRGSKKTGENFGETYTYFNSTPVTEEIYKKFYDLIQKDGAVNYGVYLHVGKTQGVAYISRTSELSLDEIRVNYEMDVTPMIYKDRTLLPLRAVGELLGFDVKWDGSTQTVYIDGK